VHSCYHCCSGRAISITYSDFVFIALGIQYTMRMRHNVICGLSGCTISVYVISQMARFSKKTLSNIKRLFEFSLRLLPEIFLIVRRTERGTITDVLRFPRRVTVILERFSWNLNFLDTFSKNTLTSHFIKIRPVGAELFRVNGQTERQIEGQTWRRWQAIFAILRKP